MATPRPPWGRRRTWLVLGLALLGLLCLGLLLWAIVALVAWRRQARR